MRFADILMVAATQGGGVGAAQPVTFVDGALPPGFALTRASTGSVFNGSGTMVFEAINVARHDHNPTTPFAYRGLLYEATATNLCPQSCDFASWTAAAVGPAAPTVSSNTIVAPDGTTTADRLTLPAVSTAGNFSLVYQGGGIALNGTYGMSVYSKGPVGSETKYLFLKSFSATYASQVVVATTAWQRFSFTPTIAVNTWLPMVGSDRTVAAGQNATLLETMDFWGVQLVLGGLGGSFILTTAAAATRAADVGTVTAATFFSTSVPDGAHTVRYTFDDASTQDAATTVAAGTFVVPTTLNRAWIKQMELIA